MTKKITFLCFICSFLFSFAFLAEAATFRIASFNVKTIGDDPQTAQNEFDALVYVLNRINADVICFQEVIRKADLKNLSFLQKTLYKEFGLDYPYLCYSDLSGTFNSFQLRTACLSRIFIEECNSWSAAELSGDTQANDITRDILEVHLRVRQLRIGVFVLHLKSASGYVERFRRAVEIIRLGQAIEQYENVHPGQPFIILGDFNEDMETGAPFGDVYDSVPDNVPSSYQLGLDVTLPLYYDPFEDLIDLGTLYAQPTHEDTPGDYSTYVNIQYQSYKRLDYIFYTHPSLSLLNTIVYDACDDNGIDDSPPGDFMMFNDLPLQITCNQTFQTSVSTTASDHFPVLADFTIKQ